MAKCYINKATIKPVLEWLEAGAPHKSGAIFDMDYGIRTENCGTVCCIAGAAIMFNEPKTFAEMLRQKDKEEGSRISEVRFSDVEKEAERILGLEPKRSGFLFYAQGIGDDPYKAAEFIRKHYDV